MKKDTEKAGLNSTFKKTKTVASGPITSWQIDGQTMERVTDYFWGSKITVDGDCSHEIQRPLLLGRKAMTNLDCILKSRNVTLTTKIHLVKAIVFPVVWTIVPQAPLSTGFSKQEYWSGLPFPSPEDRNLSDLSTMTHPSWVAQHSMA